MQFSTEIELAGIDPVIDAENVRESVRNHEVLHMPMVKMPDDLSAYYNAFVEALGTPIDIAEDHTRDGRPTGERWSIIRYDADIPDDEAFRFSKNAQPFHTDESYVSSPAGIMLFYCVNAASRGGETNYVSGQALVEYLQAERPELLQRLLTIDVRYSKANDFKHRPIVVIDEDGAVDLNYNFYCADPDQDPKALALNQDFLDFLHHDLPDSLVLSIGLAPGSAVSWRDDRVLHGRNAFDAVNTADRFILKTGLILNR